MPHSGLCFLDVTVSMMGRQMADIRNVALYERGKIMNDINKNESYMTVNEFCERMQISTSTVYWMIKNQQIPAINFGRRYKIPRSMFEKINPRYL